VRFREEGLSLNFLSPYSGPYRTMLHDLMTVAPHRISADIKRSTTLLPA
jgi:hypothetical protein